MPNKVALLVFLLQFSLHSNPHGQGGGFLSKGGGDDSSKLAKVLTYSEMHPEQFILNLSAQKRSNSLFVYIV